MNTIEQNEIKKCTEEVGIRLKELLFQRRMRQRELADATGITQAVISHYMGGTRMPILTNLVKIADVLNVSTDYLLGRVNSPEETFSYIEEDKEE